MDNSFTRYVSQDGQCEEKIIKQLAFNEKMAELGRLSVGIVHEINTPLSVIAAASQMVLNEAGLSEFVLEMVARIQSEAQRLAQLTKGILSFSREETGTGAGADVNNTLTEVMTLLKYEAQKRSITVIEEFDYQLPPVNTDPDRLKQIFINIIVNALQAMTGNGHLLLQTSQCDDVFVQVRIKDTGPGIPAAVMKRIYEPFYSTKQPGEGTGLGLFITGKIMQALGGRIAIDSIEGEGTCFTLFIPIKPDVPGETCTASKSGG
jgi:signal transduction histidine kinase